MVTDITQEMEMKKYYATVAGFALAGLLVGCSPDASTPAGSEPTNSNLVSVEALKFLLNAEPEGAADVIKVREKAKDQDEVVIVGRIGGSENPWVDGRAAFSIVDTSLESCLECGSEGCPKPWDYC
jgi:hypothetical protein